jgi:UDP-arabinose 4-epimerase
VHVLVAGGAGYIGSHTAKLLAGAGHTPVVFDNLERGHEWAVRWGPLVRAGLEDREALRRTFAEYRIAAVIHFAAHSMVGESMREPGLYFRNNAGGTLALLEAMREAGVRTIVFSSSAAVYGDPLQIPIPEDHRLDPVNPYGETKLMMERALRWYARLHGFGAACLRYFNAAGADPDGEIGEDHDPESHLIPLAIAAASGRGGELEIFGTDYATPDGTAIRDYIHVSDLAEAHLSAMSRLVERPEFLVYNLGTGVGNSVRAVVEMVGDVIGRKVPVRESGRRAGDPPALVADPRRVMSELGWRPRWSSLRAIVETAARWHADRGA